MVRKYRFGEVFSTEAVVKDIEVSEGEVPGLRRLEGEEAEEVRRTSEEAAKCDAGKAVSFLRTMAPSEIVYGLGEALRGINKRGWVYVSWNSDEPDHDEDKRSLYGSHNFLLFSGKTNIAYFFDTPQKVIFDIGYTTHDECRITLTSGDFDVYVIEGKTPDEVIHEFRLLIGRSYIPPKWAFGFGQSRWGYRSSADIREVAARYRDKGFPLDMIYMDIDYMDGYRDFTVNGETFGDLDELIAEMKEQHIHLIPIIDAAVKKDDNYRVYREGRDNDYFCKDEEGKDFVAGVWPGDSCFPDFLKPETREWFGNNYRVLMDRGIDGFWNDMNEPAVFYVDKIVGETLDRLDGFRGKNLDTETYFAFGAAARSIDKNPRYYEMFYHDIGGKKVVHKDLHNLYGYNMTRSAGEAFERISPDRRVFMLSRSSYVGMHRYSGIWQGDNKSWWSHLALSLRMLPSLNMTGFLYNGPDMGGFGADTTEDLLLRWESFSIFAPLLRNHSCLGTRVQEAYRFSNFEKCRGVIALRYRLIPYLYSEFMKAALNSTMMYRPLSFVFPEDEAARSIEDQLLIGEEIMIAPVTEQNAEGRMVYLPEPMELIRFTGDGLTERRMMAKGCWYLSVPLGDTCFFLRKDRQIPLAGRGMLWVQNVDRKDLTMLSYGDAHEDGKMLNTMPYDLYEDDGISR